MQRLTDAERTLAASLALPEPVLLALKAGTTTPLRCWTRHLFREAPTGELVHTRLEGALRLVPGGQALTLVQTLRARWLADRWLAGVVALHPLDDAQIPLPLDATGQWIPPANRLWGVGLWAGTDAWTLLDLLDGVYVGQLSQADPATVRHTLLTWGQRLACDIMGAGRDWVILTFPTLPADVEAFAAEVFGLCPDIGDTWLTTPDMHTVQRYLARHRIDGEEYSQAVDAQTIRDIAQHLRATKVLRLWWA